MTNKEWLDYLAHNAPDELAAWFDAEHVEHQERALDGDTDAQNADSREQLEADIEEWASIMDLEDQIDMIHGWLDRQAAITDAEWESEQAYINGGYKEWIADLEAQIRELTEERDKLEELNEYHALQYELASEDADRLQEKVDELTQVAESKRLSFADRIRFVNEIDELTAERDNLADDLLIANKQRDRYRSKFGKCLDYADAIHALMDDEGMA